MLKLLALGVVVAIAAYVVVEALLRPLERDDIEPESTEKFWRKGCRQS